MNNKIKEIKIPNEVEDGPSELLKLISENAMKLGAEHREWQVKMKQMADQLYLKEYMIEGVNHTFIALIEKSNMAYAVLATSSTERIEIPLHEVLGRESWENMRGGNEMKPLWLADWEDEDKFEGIKIDFEIDSNEYDDINVIVGYYNHENWEGDALVIYEHKEKLFMVNGSHCSCYGLEGQWDPEEITIEYLKHIIDKGSFVYNSDNDKEIKEYIKEYIRSIEK